jgi:flagellum-specific ATP synthase
MADLKDIVRVGLGEVDVPVVGRVVSVVAGKIIARMPNAQVGRCYRVDVGDRGVYTLLVGFDGADVHLLPFGAVDGVVPNATVTSTEIGTKAPRAEAVLGDVIDPLGVSLVTGEQHACDGNPLQAPPPGPLQRTAISQQAVTGIRAVDGLLPLGRGQRIGLFAGSGVGKSTLLSQLARGTESDVAVVALVGERGREVAEFLEDVLTEEARGRTTIVVATSDAPPLMRMRAAEMATSLAEEWRDQGRHCVLLVDSLTRYARALREVALLSGESPARRGYPASVFAALPRLLERAGTGPSGAITAVYTVLVDGGDMEEPVADEVRGIVDGHWVLRRELAERGRFPALDIPGSVSRVAPRIFGSEELRAATEVRRALALLSQHRDAIELGIYEAGSRPALDAAIESEEDLIRFCCQGPEEFTALDETIDELLELADRVEP